MISDFFKNIDQERLQKALEAADIGVWDFDPVKKEIIWSKKCDELFGFPSGQAVNLEKFISGLHHDDREHAIQILNNALNQIDGGSIDMEYRIINANNGLSYWVRVTGKAYFNESGEAIRLIGILTDITKEKKTQAKVNEKERLVKDIADSAPIALWMTDENGDCTFKNKIWSDWTGLSHEETLGNAWMDAMLPEDRTILQKSIQHAIATQTPFETDFRIVHSNGDIRWCFANGRPRYSESGRFIGLVGSCVDITERKQFEDSLQFRTAVLEAQNEATPDGILVTNGRDKILATNANFIKIWNVPSDIIESGDNYALKAFCMNQLKDRDAGIKRINILYQNPEEIAFDELHLKNGNILERYGRPIKGKDGTYYGWAWYFRDITERKHSEEALQFKTALFEAQNEATADGILIVDAKGKILSYNSRFVEIWNMPHEITETKDDYAALNHAMQQMEDPDAFIKRVRDLYDDPFVIVEDDLYLKNGHILHRHGRPVIDTGGVNYGWVWYFRDITQEKKEEESLKFKTALLEAQQEASPDGILITDGKGKIIMSNKRFAELWNIPQYIIDARDDEASLLHGMNQLVNTEEALDKVRKAYENPHITVDDEEIYFQDGKILERRARPVIGGDQKYYGWAWYFRDITEQKRAEQELQQRNAEMQRLIQEFKFVTDFMPQMVWATEPDGFHGFFNKQWYEYTGLKVGESKGEGWSLVLHPDDFDRALKRWTYSLKTGKPYEIEYRFRRKDGAYRWFLGRALPFKDDEGKILKWFGTSTDIHDQKIQTDELEQRVAERTQELEAANTNLERSNRELEQFAYIASHDLQEPLRKIRTFIDMMNIELEKNQTERVKQHIQKINQSSGRMNDLIKDLLNFSRLNLSQSDTYEKTDLNNVFHYIMEDLELAIMQKGAQITSDPLPVINAIPLQMSQLFYNLLNNSLKFSKKDVRPQIEIKCRLLSAEEKKNFPQIDSRRTFYDITFKDNGIGFSPEYAEQIFTIFQRLHSRSSFEGTGIGLALCKKIALNHQGDIYAVSEEDKGAEFHVLLPE